jgi:multidrug efflux pump subunit AcrB
MPTSGRSPEATIASDDQHEFERQTPKLTTIADARVFFRSSRASAAATSGHARRLDPGGAAAGRVAVVQDMKKMPELKAPRIEGDLRRPEITITPRLDLAADMGVTTQALSQAIRIATQGEIDQNSAKFSLSDRQIPIRVRSTRNRAQQPLDDREHAGADHAAAARCR